MSDATNLTILTRVSSFMDKNYPCGCDPEDTECDKNNSESQEIINIVIEEITKLVSNLSADASVENVLELLEKLSPYKGVNDEL